MERFNTDAPARTSLDEILKACTRAVELVRQILTFSRYQKGKLAPMDLQPVIKEALKLIRSTIPTTITIRQEIQKECQPVEADPTKIHQVIMNLATNAFHAMESSGGEMYVSLAETTIDGNGPGTIVPRGGNEHILVVDDEKTIVKVVTEMIQNLGTKRPRLPIQGRPWMITGPGLLPMIWSSRI